MHAAQDHGEEPLDATVVLVNYNGRGMLGRCLDALAQQRGVRFETVVVDNDSHDGSWDEAEGRPAVRVLRNAVNVGFGRACNQGAAGSRARHVVFVNFDSRPEPGFLQQLVALADSRPDAGAVQGLIVLGDGPGVMSAGNRAHYLGFSWAPVGAPPRSPAPHEITTGCGAGLLVPRARFEDVGGFWDALFLYHEDFDLCWRLRLRGGPILLCPDARAHHDYEFGRNPTKHLHMERGRLLVVGANYEARTLLLLLPGLLATELALLAVAARQGWLTQKLRSLASAARALPALRAQRAVVQAGRRVSDTTVLPHFETRLGPEFGERAAALSAPVLVAYARALGLPAGTASPGNQRGSPGMPPGSLTAGRGRGGHCVRAATREER